MHLRFLGNTDIQISSVIMGTWQAGKTMWVGIEDQKIENALVDAFNAGVTTFDTAEAYGNGYSERILGKALKKVRSKVVIATKVFSNHLSSKQVITACERSLRNLGTDSIDLYQIHWPAGSFGHKKIPLEETLGAMNDLKDQGKIRAIGVSNFNRAQLEEACQHAEIVSLQPPYSLFWRHVEKEIVPFCKEKGISILAYSSLAQGILTGKFGSSPRFEKGDHRASNRLFLPENYARILTALDQLGPLAEKYEVTLGQLALAWVIAHPKTCAIAGARNSNQAIQNSRAMEITISEIDLEDMDRIGKSVSDHIDDNPVMWKWS
jgi:aryl-alcohol dehydrogenase-like predicted oxidoreductase